MEIIQIDKYISYIDSINIRLYFYKKQIFSIIDKSKNILYINNKKYLNKIDAEQYKIIEYKFLDNIYNNIKLNNMPL